MAYVTRKSKLGFVYRFIVVVLRPLLVLFTKRDYRGVEYLAQDSGIIVTMNHNSWFDPFVVAQFMWDNNRPPKFLAKSGIFRIPVIGQLVWLAGQIPVYRESRHAKIAVRGAIKAVEKGEAVVLSPEGTLTRDPNLWPMEGKTGAARIALATKLPVIPVAHWGAQFVLAPYSKKLKLLPRKTMMVKAGPPVDLSDLYDQEVTGELLKIATSRIMDAITKELADLRNETPPAQRMPWTKERP
jgi:1-acyl-sn-glycerol-3-phosphate acyltransferase